MASSVVRSGVGGLKTVRTLRSVNHEEARRRAITLYKTWYKEMPFLLKRQHVEVSERAARNKLRELFLAKKDVKDLRAIDMLIYKGEREFEETDKLWKQSTHFMRYFKVSEEPRPTDFMSKFLDGHEE